MTAGLGAAGAARARLRRLAALACVLALAGCGSIGALTGGVAAIASGTASANPGVGVAVGIGVKAAVDQSINAALRHWSREEQARIAAQVGALAVGQRQPWEVRHAVPYDNKRGQVTVVRAFATPLAECKEALFSVQDADAATATAAFGPPFVTTVCRGDSGGWAWAAAEPAVARWGALQ